MLNFPLCHWSNQLFDLPAPLSTDVPLLLLNQPIARFFKDIQANQFFSLSMQLGYKDGDPLKVEDVCKFDQMHYYGTQAIDEAAQALGIK